MSLTVDQQKCTACGICASVCPLNAIAIDSIAIINTDICMECGLCIKECPQNALAIESAATAAPQSSVQRETSFSRGAAVSGGRGQNRVIRGQGGGRGMGAGGTCVCPQCGTTAAHLRGTPCTAQNCPQCGTVMIRSR
jgi:ferredoxin